MALQYVSISTQDLGGGIDAHASEDRIPEGFSQDLVNVVTKDNYLAKRSGYQLFGGGVPVRVLEASIVGGTPDRLSLTFASTVSIDAELDLTNVQATPLLIYGKMSNTTEGDFPSTQNSIHYYTTFDASPRRSFPTTTGTPSTNLLASGEFAGMTPYLFVGTTKSTSIIGNDNEHFIPSLLSVDKATFDVTIQHENENSAFQGFIYVNQKPIVTGDTYVGSFTTDVGTSPTYAFSIPASTHNLSNLNIMGRVYVDTGAAYDEIIPDSFEILATGEVTGTVINNTGVDFNFIVLISTTLVDQVLTGTAAANSQVSVLLPNMEENFLFADCYLEDLTNGNLEKVLPDSVAIDAAAQQALITFTNNRASEANFKIIYEYGVLKTNKLTVMMSTSSSTPITDLSPQLTVWGLSHEEIYPEAAGRAGWVTHIDSYRRASDQRLVCGLGWNFFASYNRDELRPDPETSPELISSTFLLPSYYPSISERIFVSRTLGPAFAGNTGTYSRTRGYYKFDGGEEGWAKGTAVNYDATLGYVKYTCTLENFSEVTGTGDVISTDFFLGDHVTIVQAPFPVHEGTFKVESFTLTPVGANATLEIFVSNPEVDSSDFDDADCGMQIGIFTGVLELTGDFNPFLANDVIYSEDIGEDTRFTVLSAVVNGITGRAEVLCSGMSESLAIPAGLRIFAERTSAVIPLRTLNNVADANYFVRDDVVSFTGFTRQMKVNNVVPTPKVGATVHVSSMGVATVELASAPSWVKPGILIPLHEIGPFSGSYEITELISSTELTINIDNDMELTGHISPHFIEIDEAITYRDDQRSETTVEVPVRWIPIETPEDSYTETPLTRTQTIGGSYTGQPVVRSSMAANTLFLTNGVDPVLKYDGRDIYHAGIPRWQAGVFQTVVTGSGIPLATLSVAVTTANSKGNSFQLTTPADAAHFLPGNFVINNGVNYEVTEVDLTNGIVKVTPGIQTAGATLKRRSTYKYYFRLEYVDANGSLITGAATQSQDFTVELTATSEVHLRLIGLPQFGPRDYDRLVVKIFRTKVSTSAPFFEVGANVLEYNEGDGYIDFIDTRADDTLTDADLDEEAISITGAEIPVAITTPQRAKYCTSTDNRLVLGYVQTYPEVNLQITKAGGILASELAGKSITFTRPSDGESASFKFLNSGEVTISSVAVTSGVATISYTGTAITQGNWVYLFRSAAGNAALTELMGWHQVVTSSSGQFTFKTNVADITSIAPGTTYVDKFIYVNTAASNVIPVWLGTDGNYAYRSANDATTVQVTSMRRLSEAINCTQRLLGDGAWLTGASGEDYRAGQCIVTSISTEEYITTNVSDKGAITWFIDGIHLSGLSAVSFSTVYPSRLLVSYRNKPEVFDAPSVALDLNSDSVIDVNTSDGQFITGVLPFFGDAAFGAAQKAAILAVFKQNSIYLVDLVAKADGRNPVQKIDSQGIGCTAPYSIANTKDGIVFANEGGIYRLNHDLTVEFLGQRVERLFNKNVNLDYLGLAQGHNYATERRYELSIPFNGATANSDMFVYDHSREQDRYNKGAGSWTRFTNFPATGWANLEVNSYFASTKGKVFIMRNTGEASDFRDDEDAISMKIDLRAMDFGDAGIRKSFPHLLLRFRNGSDNVGTKVYTATNLKEEFSETDRFSWNKREGIDALSDLTSEQVYSIRFSIKDNRGMFVQARITNDKKDEKCELTQATFKVSGLKVQGTTEAADIK